MTSDVDRIGSLKEVFVIGWSMGGWKAIKLCQEFPGKIKGLVLVSAFARYLKSENYPCGTSPALLRRLEKKFKADFKEGLNYFYGLVFKDKSRDHLINELPVPEKKDIDRWFEKLRDEDMRKSLPEIRVPVLLIHGDRDQITPPASSNYLKDNLPNSEIHILEGVGHAPMVEAPELFNSLVQKFIEKNAG